MEKQRCDENSSRLDLPSSSSEASGIFTRDYIFVLFHSLLGDIDRSNDLEIESGPLKHLKANIVSTVEIWGSDLSVLASLQTYSDFVRDSQFRCLSSLIKNAKVKHA